MIGLVVLMEVAGFRVAGSVFGLFWVAGFVFVLWLIWGGVVGFLVLPIGVSHLIN